MNIYTLIFVQYCTLELYRKEDRMDGKNRIGKELIKQQTATYMYGYRGSYTETGTRRHAYINN